MLKSTTLQQDSLEEKPDLRRITKPKKPFGLRWRSSYRFITCVLMMSIATDTMIYSILIPVMPFQLEKLGYSAISSRVGWLLFLYSAGLTLSTLPVAMLSERYNAKKIPMIIGLLVLVGALVLIMEASSYLAMCIACFLQGVASSVVWVVGLALLCDSTPERQIGQSLGLFSAYSVTGWARILVGPPVGGGFYARYGYRGPFIFGIATTLLDLIGRLLVIDRKEATWYGVDPAVVSPVGESAEHPRIGFGSDEPPREPELIRRAKPPSLCSVIFKLSQSPRALVVIIVTFAYGFVDGSVGPVIPLHLKDTWGLDSARIGIVYLASIVPQLISGPLAGWYVDRHGTEWIIFLAPVLAIPWWLVMYVRGPLALFIVAFSVESFFSSGAIGPIITEMTAVSRAIDGIEYAHVYGVFNLAYGVGSSVGPIVGGQIYDHVKRGWATLCLLVVGFSAISVVPVFFHTGGAPLVLRLKRKLTNRTRNDELSRGLADA
ncbi:major facilitator superfamily domain-containing protein [Infundibulicybe gibba]|nr:major facilitator superfamily domain-containing protein [Infundibulicybe gibba]